MTDVRQVMKAHEDSLYSLASSFPSPTRPGREAFSSAFSEKLTDSKSCVAVVEVEDELVGYISGYSHSTFYAAGPTAWVDELLVNERFRGRGFGRKLMEYFEAWADRQQCTLVGLATSGARDFYAHLGYESRAGYFKKYLRRT